MRCPYCGGEVQTLINFTIENESGKTQSKQACNYCYSLSVPMYRENNTMKIITAVCFIGNSLLKHLVQIENQLQDLKKVIKAK